MKKLFSLLFLLPFFAMAQEKIINHTVAPKESYSSIGRFYNINGRELANYNNLEYEKGLTIGQVLKVLVKEGTPIVAQQPIIKTETVIPKNTPSVVPNGEAIYHSVASKETLYGVSKKYNVSIADIKKWNSLTVDDLSEGAKIIVGYSGTNSKAVTIVKKEVAPAIKPSTYTFYTYCCSNGFYFICRFYFFNFYYFRCFNYWLFNFFGGYFFFNDSYSFTMST